LFTALDFPTSRRHTPLVESTERNPAVLSADAVAPKSVLARGLSIIDCVGKADEPLRLHEIADGTQLARPTVFRLVKELAAWGALERNQNSTYQLGHRLFELGAHVPAARALRDVAMPYMEDLHTVTGGIIHLAVLDGTDVLYLERLAGHDPAPSPSRVGGRNPAHCTGVGKAILAFSDDVAVMRSVLRGLKPKTGRTIVIPQLLVAELNHIRRVGVAIDREEIQVGLACAAAPVLDRSGGAVAAVSITDRTSSLRVDAVAPAIRTCARGISRAYQTQLSPL